MLLLVVAVQLYVLLGGGLRREGRRSWLVGLAVFCGVNAAYEIFRWLYFHDLLPNTYYLKLTGVPLTVRFLRGLAVLTDFVREHLPVLLPVGFGVGFLLRRNRRFALPAAVFVLYCVYNVYVGGDAWDGDLSIRANRFLAFVMPLVFVLLNGVLNEILGSWRRVETTEGWVGRLAASAVTTVASGSRFWRMRTGASFPGSTGRRSSTATRRWSRISCDSSNSSSPRPWSPVPGLGSPPTSRTTG
jgi:hypothetical protein